MYPAHNWCCPSPNLLFRLVLVWPLAVSCFTLSHVGLSPQHHCMGHSCPTCDPKPLMYCGCGGQIFWRTHASSITWMMVHSPNYLSHTCAKKHVCLGGHLMLRGSEYIVHTWASRKGSRSQYLGSVLLLTTAEKLGLTAPCMSLHLGVAKFHGPHFILKYSGIKAAL